MSWRFPKHPLLPGQTVTPEALNEGVRPAAEELSGQLNEHNWKVGTIPNEFNCEPDCAFVWHSEGTFVNTVGAAGAIVLQSTHDWQDLPGLSIQETMPSCLLWVHVSLWAFPTTSGGLLVQPTVALAIRIDDQLIQESIIGGGDLGNDEEQLGSVRIPLCTSIVLPVGSGEHKITAAFRALGTDDDTWIYSREIIVLQMRR